MHDAAALKRISKISVLLPALVSVFVTTGINIDPVNLPKMVVLVIGTGYLLGQILSLKLRLLLNDTIIAYSLIIFLIGIFISSIFSNSPITQTWYGSYARNTGALTYLALSILLFSTYLIRDQIWIEKIIASLFFAGIFNSYYGLLQISGLDPVDWNNTFNAVIGTFGNPNFSSAFISISLLTFPYAYIKFPNRFFRYFLLIQFFISSFAIYKTNSQQGIFLAAAGFSLMTIIYLYKNNKRKFISISGLVVFLIGGFLALMGFLQKGPLAGILYQPSISLRGFYWNAGISMFKSSPIWGIGLDSYGDEYLRHRSAASVLPPGAENVVSNAAHNVFIDIAASGGLIMLIPYITLLIYAFILSIKVLSKERFGITYLTIFSVWVVLQIESLISINQIGLAVWIWALTGILIGYSKIVLTKEINNESNLTKSKRIKKETSASSFLLGISLTTLFTFAVIPEQIADMNFKHSMATRDIVKIQNVVTKFPLSSERMSRTSQVFLRNSLNDQALEISLQAIKFNPDSLNSWITLAMNPKASIEQRQLAKDNLIRLDPRSSEWRKIVIK